MLRYLVRRSLTSVLILFVVSLTTFLLFFALPNNPARLSCGKVCTPQKIAEINKNLGIDKPVLVQYGSYVKAIFVGRDNLDGGIEEHCSAPCFGYSFANHQPVWNTFLDRFPATLSLAVGASVLFLTGGVTLGFLAALNRGRFLDKLLVGLSLLGASVQIYFIGLVAVAIFVNRMHVLPQPQYTPLTSDPGQWFTGLLLPWLTLAFVSASIYTRLARSTTIEALQQDFTRTNRARGLGFRSVYVKHAGRAAISPIITVFGLDLAGLLSGAIITESVFNIQGVGKLALSSVINSDLPVIEAIVLLSAFFIVVANLAVDLTYAVVDPRVRVA